MQTVENENRTGEIVHLDGKLFINCNYANCQVIYTGGDFAWRNTAFNNCQLTLEGAALRTANLLGHFQLIRRDAIPARPLPTHPARCHAGTHGRAQFQHGNSPLTSPRLLYSASSFGE
jgi:hypothetical protein